MQPKSSKAGKQRKWRLEAPMHVRKNFVSAKLSNELGTKYNKKILPIKKGDTVKIMIIDEKEIEEIRELRKSIQEKLGIAKEELI